MRLLLLIPTLDRSGAEKQLTLLATGLPRSEFEVEVCCLTRGGPYQQVLEEAGIPVTVIGKRFRFDPMALYQLRRHIAARKPDIVHSYLFAGNAYGRLALGRSPRVPVIISERCVDTWKAGWQFRIDRFLEPRTRRLVANSESVAAFYRDKGFPSDRIVVIPNGISVPTLQLDQASARRELGLPIGVPIVCFAGRLARQKRIGDLIWGFELIRAIRGDVLFVIAGDGPERTRIAELANQLGLQNHVRFLGHCDQVQTLLAASNLFWLASDFEGMSNSVMEAMACGLPVVASNIPPNRELVIPGQTGFLVPVGDKAGYAQFGERILFDPSLARSLGDAGRTRIVEQLSVERMVSAHVDLYHQLLQEQSPCAA